MARNEKIRQEALKWKTEDNELIAQTAFEAGTLWADEHPKSPWINTHKSLPKAIDLFDTSDLHKKIKWCLCHTKVAHEAYFIGYYTVSIDDGHKVWCNIREEEVCGPYEVDYYMPVPELPKGGER